MERSGQVVATGVSASRPSARLLAVVIIGTIVLAGCHACSLPNSQSSSDSTACYSTRPSMFCDEGPPLAPFVYTAARPVPADEQGLATEREFEAVLAGWRQIEIGNAAALPAYQKGLARLLAQANRQGRLDPRGRLTIVTTQGVRVVPISYYGFAWKPSDFSQVLPATGFNDRDLEHYYHTPGVGMSLVAVRQAGCDETYFQQRQFFPVTAILRQSQDHAVLEFYNPLAFDSRPVGAATWPLDRDLTASIICMKQEAPRRYIEGFFDPGDTDMKPKLVLMEPYQPGKIPVVFVHGLGSSPQTWDDAVNRLRAQGDIYRQFQFWYFQYPTGGDLLESAASLREKLLVAREAFDPLHRDAALQRMVLVGHSLGGLVVQLQVSYSYDIFWQHAARQPLEAVRAAADVKEQLRASFYFDPSPLVKRVVFMATPHQGSSVARRLVGRAFSKLVHYSAEEEAKYRGLIDDNRDIFREFLQSKKPTAIDLLEPDNPLLKAMACMPISRCVRWHSIIGAQFTALDGEAADGIVRASSARLPGASSEFLVSARHARVNKVDTSVDELARILREHALASP